MRWKLMWMHFNVMKHRWNWNKSESHLSQIWVKYLSQILTRFKSNLSKRKMKHSLIWWCINKTKIYLNYIWVKFKQNLSQIKIELKWWRLNLKFLTLLLRHHIWQYMWFFDDRVDEMIFIKHLLIIIQKMKRFSSKEVIFSIDVILEQR